MRTPAPSSGTIRSVTSAPRASASARRASSVSDRAAFRVLRFSDGEFTDRDGDPVQVSQDGDMWSISVGREHYRFADALITGG